jgi:hypothetical protein
MLDVSLTCSFFNRELQRHWVLNNFILHFRYKWEHSILREDINSRRVCLAYRELTSPYLPDDSGNCDTESFEILQKAMHFW